MTNSSVLELTKDLIARPSVTPDDHGCQQLLADRLRAVGFTCETLVFGEVTNLWARRGAAAPLLVFAGHPDVVSTGPPEQCYSPPFTPTDRAGKALKIVGKVKTVAVRVTFWRGRTLIRTR